jgi:hypothetical protein
MGCHLYSHKLSSCTNKVAVTSKEPETATSFNANWGDVRLGGPHHLLKAALSIFVAASIGNRGERTALTQRIGGLYFAASAAGYASVALG